MNPSRTLESLARIGLAGVAAVLLLAPSPSGAAGPSGNWTNFTPPTTTAGPPAVRVYSSAVYDPNSKRMVVFGGYPFALNDLWRLSLTGPPVWSNGLPGGTVPSGRWGHAAVYDPVRKRMLVMGGYDNSVQFNQVYALSLNGPNHWSLITPLGTAPPARRNHYMVYDPVRDRLLVFGGYTGGVSFVNDLWELTLSGTPTWNQLSPTGSPPAGRSMVYADYDPIGDRIVMFGGWSGTTYLNDLWELKLSGTPAWAPLAATGAAPTARRDGIAVYDPVVQRLVYFGGQDAGGLLNDSYTLTLTGTPNWSPLAPLGTTPSARASFSAMRDTDLNRLVIFGGYDNLDLNDAWSLSLGAGSETWARFVPAPPPSVPAANCGYAMAYDASRNQATYFGGRDPVLDAHNNTWQWHLDGSPNFTQLFTANRPSRRHSLSGAFDQANDRMLIFGGYDVTASAYLGDVWALNFSGVPDWTQVPVLPGPSPRVETSAMTDPVRQRMIVFGGDPGALNDVWALNYAGPPAWTQLFPSGTAPTARWGHNALYDPLRDRMIVFGGFGSGVNLNQVWTLEFSPTLKWVLLSPLGTPPAGRRDVAIVYDSSRDRMLLFGGYTDGGFVSDIWELSLSGAPQWSRLSPSGGPPEDRNQMQAVYESGYDRLAVYGGWDFRFLSDSWFLTFDHPTAALVSLVRASATSTGVDLVWQIGEGSDPPVAIERSTDGTEWAPLANATLTAEHRVEWTDPTAPAGRIGYRLAFASTSGRTYGGETWVEVSSRARFELRSIGPNPAVDRAIVALSLPEHGSARIEMVDLAGRRVLTRELGMLDPGNHQVTLDGLGRLPAGLYMVRLTSGSHVTSSRLMLVR